MVIDVLDRDELAFPHSLPEFQRLFPDEAACAAYLERARWREGFVCPHCAVADEPRYISTRRSVLRCRHCRRDTSLTAGTVMERTHTPLSVWFWAAYLVASQTPGISAVQFQRQLGLSRYETAFQILHKLRAGMVRPDQDRIGSAASLTNTSRPMRPGLAGVQEERGSRRSPQEPGGCCGRGLPAQARHQAQSAKERSLRWPRQACRGSRPQRPCAGWLREERRGTGRQNHH